MVSNANLTINVDSQLAMEASAQTWILVATVTGSLKLTGVMIYPVREMISAKVDHALVVLAVQTAAVRTGGKLRLTDVPNSLANRISPTNAGVIWSAEERKRSHVLLRIL